MATSGFCLHSPPTESSAVPPAVFTCAWRPAQMEVAPGKFALVRPVPCHVSVQPPFCLEMLSAPSPATRMHLHGATGSTPWLFFSSTNDSLTARRANARCEGLPTTSSDLTASALADGSPASNMPRRIFTRRMRVTASSTRLIGITPALTSARVFLYTPFQESGASSMSSSALYAAAQSSLVQPGTCPCAFQSPSTIPSKPMRSLSTPVIRDRLPAIFIPFQLENETITTCTPALIAGG